MGEAQSGVSPDLIAGIPAVAAGAILAMLVEAMIPQATEAINDYSGQIAAIGSPSPSCRRKAADAEPTAEKDPQKRCAIKHLTQNQPSI